LKVGDLSEYNAIKFDIPVLAEEFLRVQFDFRFLTKRRYVDVQVIFIKRTKATLSACYLFYCKKDLKELMAQRRIQQPLRNS